jgi:hypothetical protein
MKTPARMDYKATSLPLGAFQTMDPDEALVWLCVIVVWSWVIWG